jgi:gas vesicle protein
MTTQQKSSKFGIGLLIGTLVGGIAALFLSPKSGKENREEVIKKAKQLKKLLENRELLDAKVKEVFGEATEEAKAIYLKTKDEIIEQLSNLKGKINEIDKEEYIKIVGEVTNNIQKEFKKDAKILARLKEQLVNDWELIRK